MCDNKNELHQSEYDKSKDYTSTRLDLDITETTDSYPEFDFLDLLRNLQVKDKRVKHKSNSEVSSNKSNFFSDEDSDVEALAKLYEEKYGTCNDYAELGEGYDEEDSFIDNSDAVNDLVPSGIQTEFGGFYINRGKLNFVKEDNSSSSTSEDADKFLAQNRLNTRRIISDDESEEKETCKNQSNILQSSTTNSNIHSSNNNNVSNSNTSNNNNNASNNNHNSSNNSSNIHNNIIKNRKRSKEYQHKSKKNRKTATPKIPDHLLYKKPFPGSKEFRKNINEFKKNRLKTVESDKKCTLSNSVVNSDKNNDSDNSYSNNQSTVNSSSAINSNNNTGNCNNNNNNINNVNNNNNSSSGNNNNSSSSNNNNNHNNNDNDNNIHNNSNNNNNNNSNKNNEEDIDDKKEGGAAKKKPLTVKELLKERDGGFEECKTAATGQPDVNEKRQTSSSSDSSESSSSDSDSYSSEDTPTEKEKIPQKTIEEIPPKSTAINGSISKEITAKSFAHLSDGLKELIAKVYLLGIADVDLCEELGTRVGVVGKKLNDTDNDRDVLPKNLDDKLRELPMAERNAVLEQVAEILQMKKDNITKRIKKLLVLQEEAKMATPLRKLKDTVANIMPLLESNYFNEYTKAAGTSPQIYAELSRYYWSIDPGSLPQRKFPWNEELRRYLREIVQYRKNCYYIIRPRKESLVDYIRIFMETKVKNFWPKEWMTVDILLEEAQVTALRQINDKQKIVTKVLATQNPSNVVQKKPSTNAATANASNRKQPMPGPGSSGGPSQAVSRKPAQTGAKQPEVKSILIPRKTPQGSTSGNTPPKTNFSAASITTLPNVNQGSRLQVTLNRLNVQEYLDRFSGSQTSISRNSHQQISPNRSQQSVSPNRLVKTSSPNSVLNSGGFRSNTPQKNSSPNISNKSISSSVRNCNNQQSVLKTIGAHANSVTSMKTSPNSVTISPVNESIFKDMAPSAEVLNLTKNSSVYISKVKEGAESRTCRSSSPSIGIPLPSGITISPTSATPSTFLAKPQIQKQIEKNSDVKINVSITKQDAGVNLAKEKRETVMNINVKREGPLQNIPDCISVTSKVVPNERPKYEHVRKRALHEYHQQQHSPERLKFEEKKMKTEENLLTEMEMKEDKLDDKNFSKIFDSVIAKTSETVRQSESTCAQVKVFSNASVDSGSGGGSAALKTSPVGVSQFKNYPAKLRDVRAAKEKTFYSGGCLEEKNFSDCEERSKHAKEQRVQMEMDRVMQNLVELSREKNPEYDLGYPSPPTASSGLKPSTFQEPYQKILFK